MYIGIDIGATKTLIATEDSNDILSEQEKFLTPTELEDFYEKLDQVVTRRIGASDIHGVAVTVPGVVKIGQLRRGGQSETAGVRGCIASLESRHA